MQNRKVGSKQGINMLNQTHSHDIKGRLQAIDRTATDSDSPGMLHANDSPSQDGTQDSENFNASLHLILMSAFWRESPACSHLATPMAESDPVNDLHEVPITPESWLKFRFQNQYEAPSTRKAPY